MHDFCYILLQSIIIKLHIPLPSGLIPVHPKDVGHGIWKNMATIAQAETTEDRSLDQSHGLRREKPDTNS